jgi:hypothetical protein
VAFGLIDFPQFLMVWLNLTKKTGEH